ncbi:Hypothetical protein R9X50_00018100 [Acrodontium crateriforme]|uniref:NADH-ubiquinone oxidoreductase 17.8 kDa subunit n=1 Tax=Acrodontium crateriforme TaxID=150365 RepID=A0AAQ3M2T7_9PEZI|nr:Hypothetical protein R9X50_00018100 [Acrodontium crateriforme]
MQTTQRTALRAARRVRPQAQQQPRRFESHSSHGAHESHLAPANESFGAGFYIALAAVPVSIAAYRFTRPGAEQPYFTRYITEKYNDLAGKWAERNDTHTQAMEQAAADRVLFQNEASRSNRVVDLKYPEQFNGGSPWNVPAGHGSTNIDKVIAKYQEENYTENEKRFQQLRENKVPREQPFEPLGKSSST